MISMIFFLYNIAIENQFYWNKEVSKVILSNTMIAATSVMIAATFVFLQQPFSVINLIVLWFIVLSRNLDLKSMFSV